MTDRVFSRKTHKKSRAGCGNCKKRHVKCDEQKPCSNCLSHSIDCDFLTTKSANSLESKRASRRTFRFVQANQPRSSSRSTSVTAQAESSPLTSQSFASSPTPSQNRPLSYADFQLLHHYLTSPHCIVGDKNSRDFWRVTIPEIAFKFHFVLHLLLALSALHRGKYHSTSQQERHAYALQAEEHYLIALPMVTSLLSHMNAENCQALYVSGMLICFHHFAKGPHPGEYLVFSENGPAEWLGLLRGVRSIIETMRTDFASNIPMPPPPQIPFPQLHFAAERKPTQYQEQLQRLHQFVADQAENSTDINLQMLDHLSESFTAVYEGFDSIDSISPQVYGWLYRLPDEFIACVTQKHPVSLIIVAYFTVLLRELETDTLWFMEGWSRHVIDGVQCYLRERDKVWVEWPVQQLRAKDS